jgi:hypothetical protein
MSNFQESVYTFTLISIIFLRLYFFKVSLSQFSNIFHAVSIFNYISKQIMRHL